MTLDFTEPTGTQTSSTFDVSIDFSHSVTGFASSDIEVATTRTSGTGGNATVTLTGSGSSYTATVTPPSNTVGSVTLTLKQNAVTFKSTLSGPSAAEASNSISFDTVPITVGFTEPASTQAANTFTVPITFNKSVTGFAASDITVTSSTGTASVSLSGSGASYTATVTSPTAAKGTITLEVAKNAVTDGARTGPASKATSSAINFDTTVATVNFTEPAGTQIANTFDVPITFSKSVTGFAASDITVTSSTGTASVSLSGSGASYTATVTSPTAAKGTIKLEIAAGSVTDGTRSGPASKTASSTINFDTTVATVSFNEPAGTQYADTFDVPITFSKSVTGFIESDITVTSSTGTASVSLSGSGTSWTATVISPKAAKGTITLAVAKDAVTDGTRTAPASKATSSAMSFDTTAPTVRFKEPAGVQTANSFDVGIVFSKNVTGFTKSDVKVMTAHTRGAGTPTFNISGSGSSYTVTITSSRAAKGTVKLEIAKNAAGAGAHLVPKANQSSRDIAFDTTVPTVSLNEPIGTQTADTFGISINFSKEVTGFTKEDIALTTTLTSGTGKASFTLSEAAGTGKPGSGYTATITPPTDAVGSITLSIRANAVTDGARTGPASRVTSSAVSFDTTVPTVSFTEPASTQLGSTFNVGITFSKSVTGFEASDITVTSSTGTASLTLSGSGTDYTARVTSPTNATGTITLEVAADSVTDGTRTGPDSDTTSNAINFDTTQGTVSFTEPNGVQVANTFDVGITFSKSVTGFEVGDITVVTTHTSGSGNATVSLNGSGASYTATVTSPTTAKGTVTLAVAKDAANDGANDIPATTETSQAIAFDTTIPDVTITGPPYVQPSTFDVGITFSKSVTGFEVGDMTLTTTRTSGTGDATFTLAGSGTDYTATITPPADAIGKVTLTVKADAATDSVRNGPAADNSGQINFDTEGKGKNVNPNPTNTPPVDTTPNNTDDPDFSRFGEIIFNEIYNATSDENDWIELKNTWKESINIEGWEISIVTGDGKTVQETVFLTLPKYVLDPGRRLLIVNTPPSETAIAPGINVRTTIADVDVTIPIAGDIASYFTDEMAKLPADDYFLILRDKPYETETVDKIIDIAGTYWPSDPASDSVMWPLPIAKPAGVAPALTLDTAWWRVEPDTIGYLASAWTASGYQGGLGYDTDTPEALSLGSPGFPNLNPVGENLPSGPVAISEIMYAQRNAHHPLPQWIELYNTSKERVDLRGWELALEVHAAANPPVNHMTTITFEGVHVLPKQTLLLVTHTGRKSSDFPAHKVYDFSTQKKNITGSALENGQLGGQAYLLSSAGFCLTLTDANGDVIDKVGNLDGDPETMDSPAWVLSSAQTVEGYRSSLIRRYKDGSALPGTAVSGWRAAADLPLSFKTYWGHATDIGNPGYRKGGYLPVSLSQFRAVRTEAAVVLSWTTESELNNAGFNIYRSATRTGKFTQVNALLISGSGTTAERRAYQWKDTTARPNVAYYYRIEDVSFNGVREPLRTVRLRGHVSAAGKRLGPWASVKVAE